MCPSHSLPHKTDHRRLMDGQLPTQHIAFRPPALASKAKGARSIIIVFWHWAFILKSKSQLKRKKGESVQIDSINTWAYTPMQGNSVPQRLSDLLVLTANETPVTWELIHLSRVARGPQSQTPKSERATSPVQAQPSQSKFQDRTSIKLPLQPHLDPKKRLCCRSLSSASVFSLSAPKLIISTYSKCPRD